MLAIFRVAGEEGTHGDIRLARSTGRESDAGLRVVRPLDQGAFLRKVPQVTLIFWVIKILSTGMGETTSDYLVRRIDPVVAVMLGGVCFAAALILQLAVRRYIPWVYWLAVVMVAIFGTMVADVLHIVFHIPYVVSTVFFAIALTIVFVVWYADRENALHPYDQHTPPRAVLLGHGHHHVRARHRRGRYDGDDAGAGLLRLRRTVRRVVRTACAGLLALRAE